MPNNGQFFIRINGQLVPVSKDVYLAYYRAKRRDRYYEHDIKTETPVHDKTGAVISYNPSREDSLDRLMAAGEEFIDATVDVAAQAIGAAMSDKLHAALALLPDAERNLIESLYFSNGGSGMTEREYEVLSGIPRRTIAYRRENILGKLRKFLGN